MSEVRDRLRKRLLPTLHEEYMLGLTHYLAEKADNDEITAEQLRHAFNAGWNWLHGKLEQEPMLVQQNARRAAGTDPAMRDKITTVAGGLATVATLAHGLSAEDKAYQPVPANCYAFSVEARSYTIRCY